MWAWALSGLCFWEGKANKSPKVIKVLNYILLFYSQKITYDWGILTMMSQNLSTFYNLLNFGKTYYIESDP